MNPPLRNTAPLALAFRLAWHGVLSVFLLVLSACNTVTLPPVDLSTPGWRLREGQAVWRSSRSAPEIAGELQLATNDAGRVWLQFTKPPLPIVVAQITRTNWQVQFVPQDRSFSGPGTPPGRIAWLQLARALSGRNLTTGWQWTPKPDGAWRLENPSTGEWLDGYLAP